MANWTVLKAAIADVIKTNGNQEITGAVLQNILNSIVNAVGENATFAGVATPSTNPGAPDGNVFWIASLPGQYVNFSNQILDGEVYIFKNNNGSWVKVNTGIANTYEINGLKQTIFGLLETSAEATQGKVLNMVQNGYWAKGTVLKLSLNSDDAQIYGIAFGVQYPTGEVLNIATPSMNKVGQYTLIDDCTRVRVYAGTVSRSGTATMKIETDGLVQRILENEQQVEQLNKDVSLFPSSAEMLENIVYGKVYKQSIAAEAGSNKNIVQNGFWAKGTTLSILLSSDDKEQSVSYMVGAATYTEGEIVNLFSLTLNSVTKFTLGDDCKRIRVYVDNIKKTDTLSFSICSQGNRNNEYISNYLFGTSCRRQDTINKIGKSFAKSLNVNLRKGTNVKITFSGSAQIDYSVFSIKYLSGEKQNLYRGGINREFNIVLEEDCTRIGYYIGNVTLAGTVIFNISSEPQIKNTQINCSSISILGDSYSTYGKWVKGNSTWYAKNGVDGNNEQENDVNSVTQTWWYKLCNSLNLSLLINDSCDGSTICNTGYNESDSSGYSFIHRMKSSLGEERVLEPKPNIIILFGGTNDSWANSPLGELKYSDWTDDDLKNVLPAICYMFYYVQKWNPGALILNVVNTGLKKEIISGFQQATQYYGIKNIVLSEFGKTSGHPNIDGMDSICDQIYTYIKSLQNG